VANITLKKTIYIVVGFFIVLPYQNCGGSFAPVHRNPASSGDFQSEGYAARFEAAKKSIEKNCTSCHYAGAPGGQLLFDSEAEYINARLVTPGSVGSSKLITRLRNYTAVIAGRNMPPAGPISDADYSALTAWVGSMPLPSSPDLFTCAANEPAPALDARRLSKTEMLNSLRRILSRPFGATEAEQILTGAATTFNARVPNDNRSPFSRSDRAFESGHADAYFDLAEELANSMTSGTRYSRLVTTYVNYSRGSCSTLDVNALSTQCRDAFINNFLLRLWGRPLEASSGELAAYQSEFSTSVSSIQAVNNFLFRALLSPQFLHHIYTDVTPVASGPARLSSFAIARRLSYHFQLAGLDENTISLASSSDLSVDANYTVALNTLSQTPTPMLEDFVDDWLKLYNIASIPTPNTPKWNQVAAGLTVDSNLRTAMRREILDLVTYLYSSGRPVQEVLTSNVALARHSGLMQIYGQTSAAPTSFNETTAVRLPASQRAGIATRAGYLYNSGDSERPVIRGLHVMSDLLCAEVKGQIPAEAAMAVVPSGILTTREKYDQVTSSSSCVGCHSQINPVGNAFAKYNAFGGFQQNEPIYVDNVYRQDLPVDSRVNLLASLQDNSTVDGGVAFSQWMSTSNHFRGCFSKKYHTYTQRLTSMPTSVASCDMRRMSEVIRNNGSLADFMRAPAVDERFRRRTVGP
jgi:hypothetical protein